MEGVVQRGTGIVVKRRRQAARRQDRHDQRRRRTPGSSAISPDLAVGVYHRLRQAASARQAARPAAHLAAPIFARLHEDGAGGQADRAVPRAARHQADPDRPQERHARRRRAPARSSKRSSPARRRRTAIRSSAPRRAAAPVRRGGPRRRRGHGRALLSWTASTSAAACSWRTEPRPAQLTQPVPALRRRSLSALPFIGSMRAEAEPLVEIIKQSVGLLRRHL